MNRSDAERVADAERLAALAVEHPSVDDARCIIAEFLAQIARCPTCGGSGEVTFRFPVTFKLAEDLEHSVLASSAGLCPTCADPDSDETGRGTGRDPERVAWHCTERITESSCRNAKKGTPEQRGAHAECGYWVMLPVPDSANAQQTQGTRTGAEDDAGH